MIATRLHLYRFLNPGTVRGFERRTVIVPRCPMIDFDDENDTPEVRQLLAEGFTYSGHADGVELDD